MQPEPSFPCSQCRHMMVSCLLCDWASCSYIPITTVFCLQGRLSTWNYAHLGAWDTPLGFERLSLVTLQLNNAEIHMPQVDGRVDDHLPNCQYLFLLVIYLYSWWKREVPYRHHAGGSLSLWEEQVPKWGRMLHISEVFQNWANWNQSHF